MFVMCCVGTHSGTEKVCLDLIWMRGRRQLPYSIFMMLSGGFRSFWSTSKGKKGEFQCPVLSGGLVEWSLGFGLQRGSSVLKIIKSIHSPRTGWDIPMKLVTPSCPLKMSSRDVVKTRGDSAVGMEVNAPFDNMIR